MKEWVDEFNKNQKHIEDKIKQLEQQNAKYKAALLKYANKNNWYSYHEDGNRLWNVNIDNEVNGYELAQEALKDAYAEKGE